MSITLELPEELENELAAEAAYLGLSLADYIQRLLATVRTEENRPKTGRELVQYWRAEGLIGTRPDIPDSQQYARQLREQGERRDLA